MGIIVVYIGVELVPIYFVVDSNFISLIEC